MSTNPIMDAIDELQAIADLCADLGRKPAARILEFCRDIVRRDGLIPARDHLSASLRAADGENRAAFQMAYDELQRAVLRVLAQRPSARARGEW